MPKITPPVLEDDFNDIIAKAQVGQGISNDRLCDEARVDSDALRRLKAGRLHDKEALRRVGAVLGLAVEPLIAIAEEAWRPEVGRVPSAFRAFYSAYRDMVVNTYLVWDSQTREAVLFDTGTDATEVLETISSECLSLKYLFITHAHGDHIARIGEVLGRTGAGLMAPGAELVEGAMPVSHAQEFQAGGLSIRALLTNGHSEGGMSYLINGLEVPVVVVGDALFAGSMGGARYSWEAAVSSNSANLFTLSDETLVCPGHGPLSTIGQERCHNPFAPFFVP